MPPFLKVKALIKEYINGMVNMHMIKVYIIGVVNMHISASRGWAKKPNQHLSNMYWIPNLENFFRDHAFANESTLALTF